MNYNAQLLSLRQAPILLGNEDEARKGLGLWMRLSKLCPYDPLCLGVVLLRLLERPTRTTFCKDLHRNITEGNEHICHFNMLSPKCLREDLRRDVNSQLRRKRVLK